MTAPLIPVGYVTPAGQDPLPSTGPHLDVRVKKDGKYIDPFTIRSLLARLQVGNKPLWSQVGAEWKSSFPITSGYGPRSAPTAGASTYHPAHDYGVPEKTQLAWSGPGTFTPGKGYGTIATTDDKGTPYEIKLLHTMGGKPTGSSETPQIAQQPQTPGAQDIYNIWIGGGRGKKRDSRDFLSQYVNNQFMSALNPQAGFDPVSTIQNILTAPPTNYFGGNTIA